MVWVVQLEEIIEGNTVRRAKVATLDRSAKLNSLDELGLRLVETKALLANIQAEITTGQIERDAESRRVCPDCGKRRHIKDYRSRRFDTFFGRIEVRIPRFVCPEHGLGGAHNGGVAVLSARSTPEYDATRAKLAAQLPTA